jgi:hypothetical protein
VAGVAGAELGATSSDVTAETWIAQAAFAVAMLAGHVAVAQALKWARPATCPPTRS